MSPEAEYVAVSEACTDIMFIKMIMEFLELEVKRPIFYCDNVGAIFMGNNAKTERENKTYRCEIPLYQRTCCGWNG